MVGTTVKVRQGPFKGYRGRVVEVKGSSVRVELESQMKVVTGKFTLSGGSASLVTIISMWLTLIKKKKMWLITFVVFAVDRNFISDNVVVSTPYR